jgi:hypothetical protein
MFELIGIDIYHQFVKVFYVHFLFHIYDLASFNEGRPGVYNFQSRKCKCFKSIQGRNITPSVIVVSLGAERTITKIQGQIEQGRIV